MAVNDISSPAALVWGDLGVDVVIESTGRFRGREQGASLATPLADMHHRLANDWSDPAGRDAG